MKHLKVIDPLDIITDWKKSLIEKKELTEQFFSNDCSVCRYALGRNEHSIALTNSIFLDGFIDDFYTDNSYWMNKPVIKSNAVPENAIVINCSTSISPLSAHKLLEKLKIKGLLSYSDLCEAFPDKLPLADFVIKTRFDVEKNKEKWNNIYEKLCDEESKKTLNDILSFRLTGDYRMMKDYSVRLKEQYFEKFISIKKGDIFIDAGGFDGDTTEQFCTRYPYYGKVYLFEPSVFNMKKARIKLSNLKNIEFFELGLSDKAGKLKFNSDSGSASFISESGTSFIDVTTIDEIVKEKISFIKMDLEGWELNALKGAKKHIIKDHPILAITVYHKPSDFWQIYEFISELRTDYKIYLRHYTEGWSETVMYFIPD
ncbi:MAG: FkbM family methyltransferase [Ignavibacteriaceae bacterium]|nr:FkbM family methyltransferase [Ignavibacteriaceae bacterium]